MPSAISLNLHRNFIEITHLHGSSPISLLHNFRASFPENTSGGLFLRGAFRTLLNIYDGNFLEKYFMVFRGMVLRKCQEKYQEMR